MNPLPLLPDNRSCTACPLISQCAGPVPAEGPSNATLMFVGESPGEGEDRTGRPFQGPAGQFLNQLLSGIGVDRSAVVVSNLVKCRPVDNDFGECIKTGASTICPPLWLDKEISLVRPSIIVALGAQAARYLLSDPSFSMEKDHGHPQKAFINGFSYIVFPIFHPAAGFHQAQYLRHTIDDFKQLGRLLNGERLGNLLPHDQFPSPDYHLVETEDEAMDLLSRPYYALDTETIPTPEGQKLWSVQVSNQPGTAHFIPASLIVDPATAIPKSSLVVVHNWLYDQDYINIPNFLDTMTMAYLLQLPLGLKELAYRLCGMEMDDYQSYTRPYRKQKALEYLQRASINPNPTLLPPISRRSDPATSKEGEAIVTRSGKRKSHMELIFDALLASPGQTAGELSENLSIGHWQIHKRLGDLKNKGAISQQGERTCNGCDRSRVLEHNHSSERIGVEIGYTGVVQGIHRSSE